MSEVGLREMRQHASELVRRAQSGEQVTITVAGRPAAKLVPAGSRQWHTWEEISDLFQGPADDSFVEDLSALDGSLHDPWDDV